MLFAMSTTNLNKFLDALQVLKQDYTCSVCSQLCDNPVTLSKCFHLICGKHFETLKTCPKCNIKLDEASTFSDTQLTACVNSAKELSKIFEGFSTKSLRTSNAEVAPVNAAKTQRGKVSSTNVETKEKTATKLRIPLSESSNQLKKTEKSAEAVNMTLTSTSSKFNKTIEKRNNKGETMLHIACRLGNVDKIAELLNEGANTNTKDNAGWTPLHEVVQNGQLNIVKMLLQHNTLINVPGQSNETPLHEAVRYRHKDIAEELVKNGADILAKNCKGETPLQLADAEMRKVLEDAEENVIQTQGVNISRISALHSELDFDDIRVYCVSKYRTVHNKLKALTKHHDNLHIEAKFTKKVTHLVVDVEDNITVSSLEVLQGIVYSLWIVSTDWITESTDDKLASFDKYEVKGIGTTTNNGAKRSRFNKYKQLPGIFDGCHFYLHNFTSKYEISKTIVVTKAILTKLITDAGGVVLRRAPNPELIPENEKLVPYHANKEGKLVNCSHYIIFKDMYEPMYNMKHLKALPIGWLIECLEKYELCEPW